MKDTKEVVGLVEPFSVFRKDEIKQLFRHGSTHNLTMVNHFIMVL